MSDQNTTLSPSSGRGWGLARALRYLFVLAVLAGIGVALYYGVPYLYDRFILPVEANTERLTEVESKQATDVQLLTDQIAALQSRLVNVEGNQTQDAGAIAEATGRVSALETAVATQTKSLGQLVSIRSRLDALIAIADGHEALLADTSSALAGLRREIIFSRAIELLSRARVRLSQSNFGLAQQDVIAARDLLQALTNEIPAAEAAVLQSILARLDQAQGYLPSFPVVAADDVDSAWQLLVDLSVEQMRGVPTTETITATPTTASAATATTTPATIPAGTVTTTTQPSLDSTP